MTDPEEELRGWWNWEYPKYSIADTSKFRVFQKLWSEQRPYKVSQVTAELVERLFYIDKCKIYEWYNLTSHTGEKAGFDRNSGTLFYESWSPSSLIKSWITPMKEWGEVHLQGEEETKTQLWNKSFSQYYLQIECQTASHRTVSISGHRSDTDHWIEIRSESPPETTVETTWCRSGLSGHKKVYHNIDFHKGEELEHRPTEDENKSWFKNGQREWGTAEILKNSGDKVLLSWDGNETERVEDTEVMEANGNLWRQKLMKRGDRWKRTEWNNWPYREHSNHLVADQLLDLCAEQCNSQADLIEKLIDEGFLAQDEANSIPVPLSTESGWLEESLFDCMRKQTNLLTGLTLSLATERSPKGAKSSKSEGYLTETLDLLEKIALRSVSSELKPEAAEVKQSLTDAKGSGEIVDSSIYHSHAIRYATLIQLELNSLRRNQDTMKLIVEKLTTLASELISGLKEVEKGEDFGEQLASTLEGITEIRRRMTEENWKAEGKLIEKAEEDMTEFPDTLRRCFLLGFEVLNTLSKGEEQDSNIAVEELLRSTKWLRDTEVPDSPTNRQMLVNHLHMALTLSLEMLPVVR